jgi:hypothetical protein
MVKGNDCILTFQLGETYNQVFCGKRFAINTETEVLETTTKGDGQYQDFDYHTLSYSIQIDGLMKWGEGYNAFDVLSAQRTFMDVLYEMSWPDEVDPSIIWVMEGRVFVNTSTLGAVSSQIADHSFTFRGRGPYLLRNTAEPCYSAIGAGYLLITTNEPTSADTKVIVTTVSGDWASFNYSLDGGSIVNVPDNEFLVGVLTPGSHSITVWPVCPNGVQGTGATKSFSVS